MPAERALYEPGCVLADVDRFAIAEVRRDGDVLNYAHWSEQDSRLARMGTVTLG